MSYSIVMHDTAELSVEQIINQAMNARTLVMICEDVDDFATKSKQLDSNVGTDLVVKANGVVTDIISGYTVDGVQLVPNGDGSYTAHIYISCAENQADIYEYVQAAKILLGEEE